MKNMKGLWQRIGALCLVLCLCVSMAACRKQGTTDPTNGTTDTQAPVTYSLEVLTQGGLALSDITVFVYADNTLSDLIAVAKTDKDGKAEFSYAAGEGYVAVLSDVPQGYKTEDMYPITGLSTTITLTAELVEGDLSTAVYKLGDVMQDFTFTAADGTEYKLSRLLQEKKAVVLNFWFLSCNPCKQEFPYLQEAYEAYKDVLEVLAINPVDADNGQIAAYARDLGLSFPMGSGDKAWEAAMKILAYPTTVIIDRFGSVAMIHTGTLPDAQKFKDIFAFFTAENYTQTAVENAEELFVTESEDDTVNNPVEISGISGFQLTVQPGKIHYVNIHKMQNVWLQVNNSDIYVEYGGKKFTASNGSVGLLVSAPSTFEPAQVGFGNSGDKAQTFTVTLSNLAGSYDNPYSLQIGEFSASVSAGNDQGVYFKYTAPEDGYLKLECLSATSGVEYDYSVMNLTTSVMRSYSYDGQEGGTTGRKAVVMPMNQGETVRIVISALPDKSNNYPAAAFKMLASFDAGEVEDVAQVERAAYGVTVTDENRNPVPNVYINLFGAEDGKATASTDENGVATFWITKDVYTGSLIIPKGYEAGTTQFELSPEEPFVSLKLDTVIPEETEDYTVRVTDDEGNAMSDVLVVIGSTFGSTGANGSYTATLPKGAYKVMVVVPSGYTSNSFSYAFPENFTVLGITLTKQTGGGSSTGGDIGGGSSGGSSGSQDIAYTVRLVNAAGGAVTNVAVTVSDASGIPVGVSKVNGSGEATFYLNPGNYTFSLVSSEANLSYNVQDAVLSADKPTATVQVVSIVDNDSLDSEYWGNFYKIHVGSTRADLTKTTNQAADDKLAGNWMYMFYPAASGVYTFHISGGAVLTNYGAYVLNYIDSTKATGSFTVTVMEGEFNDGHQPAILLGVQPDAGVTEAYITVTRTADAPKELEQVIYQAKTAPKPFTLTQNGTVTYVNLEGTASLEKRTDGYYLNGKKLYVNIGKSAPYLTMSELLGWQYNSQTGEWSAGSTGTGLKGGIYEGDEIVAIEDFTACIQSYVKCCDPANGLYPLSDDLMHMFRSAGKYMGWWNVGSPTCIINDLSSLNTDIAWMFACCYIN